MRIFLWLCCIVFLPIYAYSNNSEPRKLILQAGKLRLINKIDKAIKLLEKAEAMIEADSIEFESDLFILNRSYGLCYVDKDDYKKAFDYFQIAESILKNNKTTSSLEKAILWDNYAYLFLANGEYEKSITYLLKSCKEIEGTYLQNEAAEERYVRNKVMLANCYIYAGHMVKAKEGYLSALSYFPENKFLTLKYTCHSNVGYCFDEFGEYDKAIYHYKQCEIINESLLVKQTTGANNLGVLFYLTKKETQKAKYYFEKVLDIIDNDDKADKDMYAFAAENLCTIYFDEKDYKQAYKYVNIALKSAIDVYGYKYILTNEILSEKGRILMIDGKVKAAERLFAQANQNLSIDLNDKSTYENMPYRSQLYYVLLHQSNAYLELYKRTKDLDALKRSDFISDVNIAMINSARSTLSNADSKTALMHSASDVFEVKVEISYLLYKATKDPKYYNNAFEIFELTNNIILTEAVLKDGVANRMGLPQDVFDTESSLKSELATSESKLYELQEYASGDSIGIMAAEQLVATTKSTYRSFIADLKINHPKYYNHKYNEQIVTINQLQNNLLESDQTLIHYYVSKDEIYCIAINKTEADFYLIPNKTKVLDYIKTLRKGILKANKAHSRLTALGDVNQVGFDLYNALIKPIDISLNKKLTIIPMKDLSYIPFDVLLKTIPLHNAEPANYTYLLQDHAISYGYSSTLLNDVKLRKKAISSKKNFVGFAPVFNSTRIASNRSELVSLAHNEAEVASISKIIGGDVFTNLSASKEKFVELCGAYRILHLATHGVSNSIKGENSYLAFSENEDSGKTNLLYARDIYNLKLNSDLVVLSACETAIGELQLAEGVISLARAFTYAGARSSLTTLWQVNDEAASILMQDFYEELKQGVPKDVALQQAKKKFILENPSEYVHPFYWSSFIPIGDMSSMDIISPVNYLQYGVGGGGVLVLLGVGLFFVRRRRLN